MRAQGLPISTIIIAALGILVLVILGAIFSGQIGKFGRAASECPGRCYKEEARVQDLQVEASRQNIVVKVSELYETRDCNAELETRLSGAYIPRNMPKASDPTDWRCKSCCLTTG